MLENTMQNPLPENVLNALSAGQKIEAIRLLREHTGLNLADAKAAVEAGSLPMASSSALDSSDLPPSVREALAAGNKIKAIKLLREAKKLSLKEAKLMVEAASKTSQQDAADSASGLAPGEIPRSKVSAGFAAFVIMLLLLVWLLISMN